MKFCILYDPDKPSLAKRMFEETVKHKEMIEKVCDFWVGTTKGSSKAISFWLKRLEEEGLEERYLFPGQVWHALAGKHAKYILRPELLNKTPSFKSSLARLYTKLGKLATRFLYPYSPPYELDFGYLILGPGTSVGDFTGAARISDEDALACVENYLEKNKACYGVYIEGGSGARIPVSKRIELIKKAREILPSDKVLHAGGGIRSLEELKLLLDLGTKPVISTHFEEKPKDIYRFAKEVYKRV
ncbi:MAG TPA: hypothetical protein ENF99_01155 [Candidatus Aenigmarchaeota archaeon]|nr:hypothetical protein [Candidatus Aenigmarchaeota archaeon]